MVDHNQIPPEIFATIFEVIVSTWDIRFLLPLCLVCRAWNDIIATTPRLWGIITVDNESHDKRLQSRIAKAKSSPLVVSVHGQIHTRQRTIRMLVDLSHNWIQADVPTWVLAECRWSAVPDNLERLKLRSMDPLVVIPNCFDPMAVIKPARLRSFSAVGLTENWILPFLSPSITYLELNFTQLGSWKQSRADTLKCLTRTPELVILKLDKTRCAHDYPPSETQPPVHLAKLKTLELRIFRPSALLREISAPSLETLIIHPAPHLNFRQQLIGIEPWSPFFAAWSRSDEIEPLTPFLIAWSHNTFLPTRLHTLVLVNCLKVEDVAFLIRWLARLTSLVRLKLWDGNIAEAAALPPSEEETNVFKALASPQGVGLSNGGWLCPSLMELRLAIDIPVAELIPLARARGGRCAATSSTVLPGRLRYMEAHVCTCGTLTEIQLLKDLIDEVRCVCFGCQFKIDL